MEVEVPAETSLQETSLQDALDALRYSDRPALPLHDREGRLVAVLTRPEAAPSAVPPRLGGMATPLGVYLHDGVSSGGAGAFGLVLTGMTMSVLALTAQAAAHGVSRLVSAHFPMLGTWESHLPSGLSLWLSAISPWLPLPFVFLLLRLVPLSGIHAAEHQVVHCVERRQPLTLIYWRRAGGWVQQWFATRPATDGQIAGAIFAAEQVLSRHQRRLERGQRPRFAPLRRIWTAGLAQILLGYFVVISLLLAAENVWPGLALWLD